MGADARGRPLLEQVIIAEFHAQKNEEKAMRLGKVGLFVAALVVTGAAGAQQYPAKPVRIVVPFAPGGSNDILARLVGQKLTEAWGQQVIVENRGGGGTVIGTDVVAKSAPDGYTLLMVSPSHSTNPTLVKKLPFDTLHDLALVILLAHSSNVLLAHPSLPARSVKELLALARSRPDEITFGSGCNGTSTHLSGELLSQRANVKMVHVPYKGAAPAGIALISGEVTWLFGNAISLGAAHPGGTAAGACRHRRRAQPRAARRTPRSRHPPRLRGLHVVRRRRAGRDAQRPGREVEQRHRARARDQRPALAARDGRRRGEGRQPRGVRRVLQSGNRQVGEGHSSCGHPARMTVTG